MGKKGLKGLVVYADDTAEVMEFCEPYHKSLGNVVGGYIEIVKPRAGIKTGLMKANMCMIVNEEGKLHNLPMNKIGTLLYSYPQINDIIVGNIIFLKTTHTNEGVDFTSLSTTDIDYLTQNLRLVHRIKKAGK